MPNIRTAMLTIGAALVAALIVALMLASDSSGETRTVSGPTPTLNPDAEKKIAALVRRTT